MLTWLHLSRMYYVKSEYEVQGGYIDIALLSCINVNTLNHAIIELKYIPKNRFADKLLQEKIFEAEAQLSRYATSEELRQVPNLLKFMVVFKGDECVCMQKNSAFRNVYAETRFIASIDLSRRVY